MSGTSIAQKALNVTQDDDGQTAYISVGVLPTTDAQTDMGAVLRNILAEAGYRQPTEPVIAIRDAPSDPWRIVAPGIAVRASEYEARFAHLDLETLRNRLTPEVFRAFIRHIGIIQGPDDVDVNMLVDEEMH